MKSMNMEVSFTEFVKTGFFGFLRLGMSKEEIEYQKFPPEYWLNGKTKETSVIWRYGNIELYFDEQNKLNRIFTDYVSEIDGGELISITDYWILPNGEIRPTLSLTLEHLNTLKLSFTKTVFEVGYIEIKLSNGVYFLFDPPDEKPNEDQNNWLMYVIGKK